MNDAVVDWQLATRRAGDNPELAADLHAMLLEELPERIGLLEAALEQDARGHLKDPIHRLAGSCRYCGVPGLEAAVEALNTTLKEGERPSDEALLSVIEAARGVLASS